MHTNNALVRLVPVNPVVFIVAPRARQEQRLLYAARLARNLTSLLTSLIYFSAIRAAIPPELGDSSRAECKMQIYQGIRRHEK
jgi:hypothetical protein